jgi:hypothetical protein
MRPAALGRRENAMLKTFADLSTPLVADACVRSDVPLRAAPPGISAVPRLRQRLQLREGDEMGIDVLGALPCAAPQLSRELS